MLTVRRSLATRSALTFVVVLWVVAVVAYPGWSQLRPTSTSYDPLRNFICDLLSSPTPDGRPNGTSATAMAGALTVLVLGGLAPLWWRLATGTWLRALSGITVALTLTIVVEQAFAIDLPHGPLTLLAGATGAAPTAAAMVVDWRSAAGPVRRTIILGVIAAVGLNFVSYAIVQLGAPLPPVVPTAQFCALGLTIVWLWVIPGER